MLIPFSISREFRPAISGGVDGARRQIQAAFRPEIVRLKEMWAAEYAHWNRRDLTAKHYVYLWADGVHFHARLEDTPNACW